MRGFGAGFGAGGLRDERASSDCFIEVNNAGTVITPAGNFCGSAGNEMTLATTTDGSGNAWFQGTQTISKVSPAGSFVRSGVNTDGCFAYDGSSLTTAENSTTSLVYDRVHNQLWGAADIGIGALRADGSEVFCDGNADNLPLFPNVTLDSSGNGKIGFLIVASIAVDGEGNFWFTAGGGEEDFVNSAPVGGASYAELNELDLNGRLLTPYYASAGIYGLDLGAGGVQVENGMIGQGLAIDAYGNIWIANNNSQLVKIPGLAVPKNYQ